MSKRSLALALLAALATSMSIGAVAGPAAAAQPTDTEIVTSGPLETGFGSNWVVEVTVTDSDGVPVDPTGGTIDAYVVGIAGPIAHAVPLQAGARAYVSQPDAGPLLPAGTYDLSAVFVPAPGSGLEPSQAPTTLQLTVTPIALTPSFSLTGGTGEKDPPVVVLDLGADSASAPGGAPSGTWSVAVTDEKDATVFTTEVAQPASTTGPLRVPVEAKLDAGQTYSIAAGFAPEERIAGGITVAPMAAKTFTTPETTFADWAATPVALPIAVIVGGGALVALLVLAAVLLPFLLRRRRDEPVDALEPDDAPEREPAAIL
ncbi:hypothetical protein [Naasia aerilata]|uniref:Uncharacterized protein n=1 Tax=Naasia aerilata TaxID=1162966 RepID=A0ABM8G8A5_9MICO|nr:hypothetical protein [Naasia aerilata]BDZ44336.1 hypothetical protein GCM10025866_02450 [Naasia aerilata]